MIIKFSSLAQSGLFNGRACRAGAEAAGNGAAQPSFSGVLGMGRAETLGIALYSSVLLQICCQELNFLWGATTLPILIFLNSCSVLVPSKGLYIFLIKNKVNIKRVVRGAVGRKPTAY